ncbi:MULTISPECIES: putative metalloprotease CJM1_0395 family protein [Alteromonas]|uniref:putative metalloprotease CJM1_0395 family protein n=1 Tax=Alteromonas TaxID=226 RepID=UPI00126F2C05|nr:MULTISPECIES: putative metalloprotease CJM1_0395 family protein [Alteromonas]CAI2391973.1 SprA-related family protein [Alteromonas macleodii]CAI3969277.1 SprA-related family protein [Alteromonas macleodii]CAI3969676.1 SprA-related family protein [Alteromonas macleodii]CAI3969679.1 SprA-related family protein [Alteromonas macleodii]VTO41570.1 SprA-related family protein [Alteromonas macleodii]
MNIVTPILNAIAYPTANINTESARRDNVQRETIPQASDSQQGASQKGLGSEADKAKSPGQPPSPVTYERPQVQTELQAAFQNVFGQQKDNAQDESAGKQDAQDRQQEQQEKKDAAEIEQLKARDQEVRVHEQAHASTGGQYAGAPQYEYTTGPDNKRYVTDGEVSIDVSEEKTPEETLKKMEQVRAAALAPAEPSSQDLKVAAEASQKATEARSEIAKGQTETASAGSTSAQSNGIVADTGAAVQPDTNIGTATDSIADMVLDNQSSSADTQGFQANESNVMQTRIGRIQNAYLQAYTPSREGLSLQA